MLEKSLSLLFSLRSYNFLVDGKPQPFNHHIPVGALYREIYPRRGATIW